MKRYLLFLAPVLGALALLLGWLWPAERAADDVSELSVPATKAEVAPARAAKAGAPLPPPLSAPAEPAIGEFRSWAERYARANAEERAAMRAEGVRLAQAHRAALKALIIADPKKALEQAVPMVLRQELPAEVVSLLEERVSGSGAARCAGGFAG